MTPAVVPVYAGIVVSDVGTSTRWYEQQLPCYLEEEGRGWSCLVFPDRSTIELFAGDPRRAGDTFPSYAGDEGPPVLPGYAVEDPEVVVAGLQVTRTLPDWHVVVAPDGVRIVVTLRDTEARAGLAGFRFTSPVAAEQRSFLALLGIQDDVVGGEPAAVVPLVAADRPGRLVDPDGTRIDLVAPADTLATGT